MYIAIVNFNLHVDKLHYILRFGGPERQDCIEGLERELAVHGSRIEERIQLLDATESILLHEDDLRRSGQLRESVDLLALESFENELDDITGQLEELSARLELERSLLPT